MMTLDHETLNRIRSCMYSRKDCMTFNGLIEVLRDEGLETLSELSPLLRAMSELDADAYLTIADEICAEYVACQHKLQTIQNALRMLNVVMHDDLKIQE